MDISDIVGGITELGEDVPKPAILLYVDSEDFYAEGARYGVTRLESTLRSAGFRVDLHIWGESAALGETLLADYDEVWFLLLGKEKVGGLGDGEVEALRTWMDRGGGVLITGDHAVGQHPPLEGIGRTVGRRVPRARHLRAWDRPGKKEDQEPHDTRTIFDAGADVDGVPQRLLVQQPRHHLFNPARPYYLPDHSHEGVVLAPALPTDEDGLAQWRAKGDDSGTAPPRPRVIAKGVDWASGDTFDLMAEWDGEAVGVGRILADSSWHHYTDSNLASIGEPFLSRILDFYVQQAWWLLAAEKRCVLLARALAEVMRLPDAVDYEHTDVRALGELTLDRLRRKLPTVLHAELVAALRGPIPLPGRLAASPAFETHMIGTQVKALLETSGTVEALSPEVLRDKAPGILTEAIKSYEREIEAYRDALEGARETISSYRSGLDAVLDGYE